MVLKTSGLNTSRRNGWKPKKRRSDGAFTPPPPPNVRSFAGITTTQEEYRLERTVAEPRRHLKQDVNRDDLGSCVTALVNVITKAIAEEVEPFGGDAGGVRICSGCAC